MPVSDAHDEQQIEHWLRDTIAVGFRTEYSCQRRHGR
jgi:hypothetical protein